MKKNTRIIVHVLLTAVLAALTYFFVQGFVELAHAEMWSPGTKIISSAVTIIIIAVVSHKYLHMKT